MADQTQLDRLRRDCSAKLKHFMTVAHQTERHVKGVGLPIDAEAYRRLMDLRQKEYDACHEYLLAAQRLADFMKGLLHYIQ